MSRSAFDLLWPDGNVQVNLLERADRVISAIQEELDWTHHPRPTGEQVEAGILPTLREWYPTDLQIQRYLMFAFCLENPEHVTKLLAEGRRCPAYNFSIQMDAKVFTRTTINNGREWLGHTKGIKESGNVGYGEKGCDESTRTRKVI